MLILFQLNNFIFLLVFIISWIYTILIWRNKSRKKINIFQKMKNFTCLFCKIKSTQSNLKQKKLFMGLMYSRKFKNFLPIVRLKSWIRTDGIFKNKHEKIRFQVLSGICLHYDIHLRRIILTILKRNKSAWINLM